MQGLHDHRQKDGVHRAFGKEARTKQRLLGLMGCGLLSMSNLIR